MMSFTECNRIRAGTERANARWQGRSRGGGRGRSGGTLAVRALGGRHGGGRSSARSSSGCRSGAQGRLQLSLKVAGPQRQPAHRRRDHPKRRLQTERRIMHGQKRLSAPARVRGGSKRRGLPTNLSRLAQQLAEARHQCRLGLRIELPEHARLEDRQRRLLWRRTRCYTCDWHTRIHPNVSGPTDGPRQTSVSLISGMCGLPVSRASIQTAHESPCTSTTSGTTARSSFWMSARLCDDTDGPGRDEGQAVSVHPRRHSRL